MGHKFKRVIPKIPVYKKNTYTIPKSYSKTYEQIGITDYDEQKALFFVTQFGGFRLKRIPSYFKDSEEFFSKWFKSKNEQGFFHFKANTKFISKLSDIKIEPVERNNYKTAEYRDEFLTENGFSKKEADEIQRFQDNINEFYRSLRLNIIMPNSGITGEDKIDLSRFNSVPHLQYKPKAGGRFFQSGPGGSYQRISNSLRPFLTINGEKTSEIDITAATIQFLNITLEKFLGHSPISKKGLSQGDPYKYFLDKINSPEFKNAHKEKQNLSRDNLKNLIYTLIYSSSSSEQRNINRHLKIMGKHYYYSDLEKKFPEFFKVISEFKTLPLIDGKIYPAHITIYKEESKFAREVLERGCLEKKIAILPIHDSFITTSKNVKKLEHIIRDVSQELYGYILPYKQKD
jgi:hypothetical protein